MTAKGKVNASNVQTGDRIIIERFEDGHIRESARKTGDTVEIVRVTGKTFRAAQGRYERRGKYVIETTAGTFEAAPIQTMFLAPEDAAGIKRAYAEALAENVRRNRAVTPERRAAALAQAHAEDRAEGRTVKLTGAELRPGMRINGREIEKVRQGVGSGKPWTFVTYRDADANGSRDDRFRRNTTRVEVELATADDTTEDVTVTAEEWEAIEAQAEAWIARHVAAGTDASRAAYATIAYREADHLEALVENAQRDLAETLDEVLTREEEAVTRAQSLRADAQVIEWAGRHGTTVANVQNQYGTFRGSRYHAAVLVDHQDALELNADRERAEAYASWGNVWAGHVPAGLVEAFKADRYAEVRALAAAQIARQEEILRATEEKDDKSVYGRNTDSRRGWIFALYYQQEGQYLADLQEAAQHDDRARTYYATGGGRFPRHLASSGYRDWDSGQAGSQDVLEAYAATFLPTYPGPADRWAMAQLTDGETWDRMDATGQTSAWLGGSGPYGVADYRAPLTDFERRAGVRPV